MSKQLGTIGFKQIVKNYQSLAVLGEQIILHKQHIKNVKPELLDKEFNALKIRQNIFNNMNTVINYGKIILVLLMNFGLDINYSNLNHNF